MVLGLRFGAGAATSGAGAGAPVAPVLATGLTKPQILIDDSSFIYVHVVNQINSDLNGIEQFKFRLIIIAVLCTRC